MGTAFEGYARAMWLIPLISFTSDSVILDPPTYALPLTPHASRVTGVVLDPLPSLQPALLCSTPGRYITETVVVAMTYVTPRARPLTSTPTRLPISPDTSVLP